MCSFFRSARPFSGTNLLYSLLLCLLSSIPLSGNTGQSVKDQLRQWTFKNGNQYDMRLQNAYGGTVYFSNKKDEIVNTNIVAIIPEDQAEVVYWYRIRDA
jgi:hypothetical protein